MSIRNSVLTASEAAAANPFLIILLMAACMVLAASMISLVGVMLRDGFLAACWGFSTWPYAPATPRISGSLRAVPC